LHGDDSKMGFKLEKTFCPLLNKPESGCNVRREIMLLLRVDSKPADKEITDIEPIAILGCPNYQQNRGGLCKVNVGDGNLEQETCLYSDWKYFPGKEK
jgi:hypothetical protein